MAFANSVFFTAGSSGLSDFADGTAKTGFRNLSVLTNGQPYSYRAVSLDRSQWENGRGNYNSASGGTIARTTIYESSNAGSKVNFSSAPLVFITPLAADFDLYILASLLTTRGDIIRRGASAPERLALGTTGRVLQSDGTDTIFGLLASGAFATGPGIVTPAMLDNAAALTILGRSANSSGVRADIAAGANDTILRRVSNALDFGQITAGMIPSAVLTFAMLASSAYIASGEFRSNTASKLLTAAGVWSDAGLVALTDAATISNDMSNYINASCALGGNRTLGAPSNPKVGQTGVFVFTASTSTRTIDKHSNFKSTGITWPISITTSQTLYLPYWVESSTRIVIFGSLLI